MSEDISLVVMVVEEIIVLIVGTEMEMVMVMEVMAAARWRAVRQQ